jgi:5,10-methylenetetrahydromethanopterin reductase
MSKVAFGVELFQYLDAPTLVEEIKLAEHLGFETVWLGDSQLLWRELYVLLGAAAVNTSRITLASGVTNPVTRHPAVTASALMTLQELSGNRALLGIGVGFTSLSIMGLPPTTRAELRRYVEAVRALCRGETVEGERVAMHLAFGAPDRCPPVVIPGSGPKMLRLAGEIGDGVILQSCPPFPGETYHAMIGHVREGRAAAGREYAPFTTYLGLPAAAHRDRATAMASVKSHIAVGLLKPKWPISELALSAQDAVRAVYTSSPYDHMNAASIERFVGVIPDAVVPEFAIAGTPDECIEQCRALFAAGIDEITVRLYEMGGESRMASMEAFARDVIEPLRRA